MGEVFAFALISLVVVGMFSFFVWAFSGPEHVFDHVEADADGDSIAPSPRPTETELLSSLPATYYGLAIFCGIVLLFVTLVNAKDLSGAEIGGLIGYTVGAVLSMFAVGRVIQLLQQIRDAVRNAPALSPNRPGDE